MTDDEKKVIEDNMPRFATLQDANAYAANPDPKFAVPRYVQRGNALILNPAWTNAHFGYYLIWGPSVKVY